MKTGDKAVYFEYLEANLSREVIWCCEGRFHEHQDRSALFWSWRRSKGGLRSVSISSQCLLRQRGGEDLGSSRLGFRGELQHGGLRGGANGAPHAHAAGHGHGAAQGSPEH